MESSVYPLSFEFVCETSVLYHFNHRLCSLFLPQVVRLLWLWRSLKWLAKAGLKFIGVLFSTTKNSFHGFSKNDIQCSWFQYALLAILLKNFESFSWSSTECSKHTQSITWPIVQPQKHWIQSIPNWSYWSGIESFGNHTINLISSRVARKVWACSHKASIRALLKSAVASLQDCRS